MSKYAREMERVSEHVSCWIAPDGKFHPVDECQHERYCREHIFKLDPNDEDAFWEHDGAILLEKQGWLHVSGGTVDMTYVNNISQAQIDTLFDFGCVVEKNRRVWHGHKERLQDSIRHLISLTA